MAHELRRKRVASRLAGLGIDALLVTRPPNVRYLTGFTGSNGQVLVGADAAVFLTDGRYIAQSRREVDGVERRIYVDGFPNAVAEACRALGASRLGFESAGVTYRTWRELAERLEGIGLVPVGEEVERLRWTKEAGEVAAIERAQVATDDAFEEILGRIAEGMTERELAFALEVAMRGAGAHGVAFDTIAAFGENAAEPHHDPTDRALVRGDMVKMDFGALVDGYHADMTRTVAFGEPPGALREVHEVVHRAQEAGIAAARAGVPCREVDRAARRVVEEAGYGDAFSHGLGHGVGLEIHEGPRLRRDSDDVLPAGAIVTVEPGVYLPGLGGVRIEDMVEVTEDGCRVIPRSTKELIVL